MFTLMYKTSIVTLTVIGTLIAFLIGVSYVETFLASNPNLIP